MDPFDTGDQLTDEDERPGILPPYPIRLRQKLATRRRTMDVMKAQGRPFPKVWEDEIVYWEMLLDDFYRDA